MDYTSKGLRKPQDGEPQDVGDLNFNSERVNSFGMGAYICTSTTRPTGSDRWDGLIIKETDTHRFYAWNAALGRWQYLSGGHGDPAPTTGANNTNGLDFSVTGATTGATYQDGIEPYSGTDRWGPELIRDSNGDAVIQGTMINTAAFTGWAVNIQYVFAKLHPDAIAAGFSIPARDAVGVGAISVGGVTGYDPCLFIVRGSAAGSGYTGAPGDIIMQPTITRAGPVAVGTAKFTIANGALSWRL